MNTPLLDKIQSPADLALLKEKELALLCRELRGVITDSVSRNGGHLA
ncbi:MAG: hypothetical protein IJC25_06520, partial [Clostridia bacterium]|nr:hypothetical protein [Clostridia bacterium]